MLLFPLSFQYSSDLCYDRTALQVKVSDEAGYGLAVPTDSTKLTRVNAAVQLGSQWWYNPGKIEDVGTYEWSFLKPYYTVTTVAGQGDYDLPYDYAGHEGKITYGPSQGWTSFDFVAPYEIEEARQEGSSSGYPRMATVNIVRRDHPQGQLFQISFYPTPGSVFSLKFRMNIVPPLVSEVYPFVYGSAVHSDTVLACCFAAFEFLYRKGETSRYDMMVRRLLASVELDRKTIRHEYLGYNANYSDQRRLGRYGSDGRYNAYPSTLTFNGATV